MVKSTFNSIKNLLVKEQNEIISAVSILMVLSLITKVTGMVFLTLVARQFGASKDTDLFYLASVIPEMITNIILLGAVSGAIIPIFVKVREKEGEAKFMKSFSSTMNMAMVAFIILSLVAAIFSRELVPFAIQLVQHKDYLSVDQLNMVVWMMRLLLIPQVILGVSAFISTSLNIYQRFVIPQLAPLFFNFGKIIGVLIIVPLLGGSIWGLVVGTFLGAVLHLVIQIPLLYHLNVGFKPFLVDIKDVYFREVMRLGFPRTLSLSAEQFATVIDSLIAFGLTAGSLTAYQLAVRLVSFPLMLFGTSYSIAAFPALSKFYAKGLKDDFALLVQKIVNQIFFLTIPVTVLMLILRIPIVRLVYGILGGNFSWDDTRQVAWLVLFFSLGLTFETMRSAIFRIYYAAHNSLVPLLSSIMIVVLGVVTGVMFTNYFSHFNHFSISELTFNMQYFFTKGDGQAGVGGLALSSSVVFTFEFFVLMFVLFKKKILTGAGVLIKQIGKMFIAGLVMLVLCYAMAKLWEQVLDTAKTLQLIILTTTTIVASCMLYLWSCFVLKIPEVELFIGFVIKTGRKLLSR